MTPIEAAIEAAVSELTPCSMHCSYEIREIIRRHLLPVLSHLEQNEMDADAMHDMGIRVQNAEAACVRLRAELLSAKLTNDAQAETIRKLEIELKEATNASE